jgi:predicted ribosomally synthesized peptide with SipW-like signal peptide
MKRISFSLVLVLMAVVALAAGSTGAFFTDAETSTGNTFTAGAIDLKIDNTSYYNGNVCANPSSDNPDLGYIWVGTALFPVPGTPCTTTWASDDLNDGEVTLHKFFDFFDLKPGDQSEDTISLHTQNDAYLCAEVKLTSNKDNDCTTPEDAASGGENGQCGEGDSESNGDLAQNVNFIWWADDGDNVLESNETVIPGGNLGQLGVGNSAQVVLADSNTNIWTGQGGPITASTTMYIGKAWCFGDITADSNTKVAQDGQGAVDINPTDGIPDNGPDSRGGGFLCNGSALDNKSQTDTMTADVTFEATQARNNPRFTCEQTTTLTLVKEVDNDVPGGTHVATDWTLFGTGPTPISGVTGSPNVTNAIVGPGVYTLAESPNFPDYLASDWSCTVNGGAPNVVTSTTTVNQGDHVVCTITNSHFILPAHVVVNKIVVNNNGGNNIASDFQLFVIDGGATQVQNGSSTVFAPGPYIVTEDGVNGYQASFSGDCDVSGNIIAVAGATSTCTITNDDIQPNITLHKVATGTPPLAPAVSFQMKVDGGSVPQNTSIGVTANSPHTIDEVQLSGYSFLSMTGTSNYGKSCPAVLGGLITLDEGEAITCTITNQKNP